MPYLFTPTRTNCEFFWELRTTHVFLRTARLDARDGLADFARFAFDQLDANARRHATVMARGYRLPFPSDDAGLLRQKRQRTRRRPQPTRRFIQITPRGSVDVQRVRRRIFIADELLRPSMNLVTVRIRFCNAVNPFFASPSCPPSSSRL